MDSVKGEQQTAEIETLDSRKYVDNKKYKAVSLQARGARRVKGSYGSQIK